MKQLLAKGYRIYSVDFRDGKIKKLVFYNDIIFITLDGHSIQSSKPISRQIADYCGDINHGITSEAYSYNIAEGRVIYE